MIKKDKVVVQASHTVDVKELVEKEIREALEPIVTKLSTEYHRDINVESIVTVK